MLVTVSTDPLSVVVERIVDVLAGSVVVTVRMESEISEVRSVKVGPGSVEIWLEIMVVGRNSVERSVEISEVVSVKVPVIS